VSIELVDRPAATDGAGDLDKSVLEQLVANSVADVGRRYGYRGAYATYSGPFPSRVGQEPERSAAR